MMKEVVMVDSVVVEDICFYGYQFMNESLRPKAPAGNFAPSIEIRFCINHRQFKKESVI